MEVGKGIEFDSVDVTGGGPIAKTITYRKEKKWILALPVMVGLIVGRGTFEAMSRMLTMLSYSSRIAKTHKI